MMSSWPNTFIGSLVLGGYMCSYHEHTVYLHDSQGKRWAEIDPHGIMLKVTVYARGAALPEVTFEVDDFNALVERLEELA